MVKFCDQCKNLLVIESTSDRYYFKCNKCLIETEPDADDTLLYEETNHVDSVTYEQLIHTASKDPMNPKAYVTCPKCSHNIARQIRLNMRLINFCIECNHSWLYSDTPGASKK